MQLLYRKIAELVHPAEPYSPLYTVFEAEVDGIAVDPDAFSSCQGSGPSAALFSAFSAQCFDDDGVFAADDSAD